MSAALVGVHIGRMEGCDASRTDDVLAVEEPLEIRLGERSLSITMRTPGNDFELAAGFPHSEGMIANAAQISPRWVTRPAALKTLLLWS